VPHEELQRLTTEYAELQASDEEEAARDAVSLHDAQLVRLKLRALLERLEERQPRAEELAERYESQIDEWSCELRHLREENALLALHHDSGVAIDLLEARPTRSAAAAQRLHSEAKEAWHCQAKAAAGRRRNLVNEWYLSQLRVELQDMAQSLRGRVQQLRDMRKQFDEAENQRQALELDRARCHDHLVQERQDMVQLHKEALVTREACMVPAQLKKKSSTLTRFLDQEGSRARTEKHLRGLQAASKLYSSIVVHAPALQPCASRAKAAMEAEFARYQQLEQQHTRLLQQLNLSMMRNALGEKGEQMRGVPD